MHSEVALAEAIAPSASTWPYAAPAVRSAFQRHFDRLEKQYVSVPLEVSFRELVGPLPAQEMSHGIYPYPARLLRQIPRMLLACEQIVGDADFILDPFCGSGTVLLEGQLAGLEAIGFDQNPIAALVARVKTTPLVESDLQAVVQAVVERAKCRRTGARPPAFVRRWYSPDTLSVLGRLLASVQELAVGPLRDFMSVSIALIARQAAATDKRIPVPVRPAHTQAPLTRAAIWKAYERMSSELVKKVSALPSDIPPATVSETDARDSLPWKLLPTSRSGLLLTSPPYGAAQKYVRSTSLEAAWLGFTSDRGTVELERTSVGREHLSKEDRTSTYDGLVDSTLHAALESIATVSEERSLIYLNYFLDMQQVIRNASAAHSLERIVLVAGTNVVTGSLLDTRQHLGRIAQHYGFERTISLRDEIQGRAFMTKRRDSSAPGAAEYVEVFERTSP